jgi:ABC-type sugar transport system substrate-binding protein
MNKPRVVVSLPNANAYLHAQAILAKSVGEKLGFEMEVIHAGDDAITQSQQLLNIIHSPGSARPCAFIVEPLTGAGLRRVAQAAVAQGIAWVISNCDVDYIQELRQKPEPPVFAVTQGQTEIGHIQGRQIAALAPPDASVLYVHGPGMSPVAKYRRQGMEATKPAQSRVTTIRCQWNEEDACRAVGAWLRLATSRAEKFDLVAGQTHELALGARKAFQNTEQMQQKKWLDLPFIGVGIAEHVEPLVKKHILAAGVVTSLTMELALQTLASALKTKTQPPDCTPVSAYSSPPVDKLRPYRRESSRAFAEPKVV